jgi:hypothetical protein
MRNYKIEMNLGGASNWPNISFVAVRGVAGKESVSSIKDSDEREKIIQTWNNIAVMKATSEKPTKFFVGFFKEKRFQYFKHAFATNFEFGMRVGPEDVKFFVLPVNLEDKIKLELLDQTAEDDPKYTDLTLI